MSTATQALLLLADGRFPIGGHVHSGGIEAAMTDGRVRTIDDVESFMRGRLSTVGTVDAALAAATVHRLGEWSSTAPASEVLTALDGEASARIPVAALRRASRRQGHQLLRVAARAWPSALFAALAPVHDEGPNMQVALGAVVHVVGGDLHDAAMLSLHHCLTTPTQAAVRIGGLDPFAVAALTARLGPLVAELADAAVVAADRPLHRLPALSGPLLEIAAAEHARRDNRLFVT